MQRKLLKKSFTLVELLVVIAIIGILAGLILPRVKEALVDAQRTAALTAAKTFEDEIFKYNTKHPQTLDSMVSKNAVWDEEKKSHENQLNLYFLMAGLKEPGQTAMEEITGNDESGKISEMKEAMGDNDKFYELKLPRSFFDLGDTNTLITGPEEKPFFALNEFSRRFQFAKRTSKDRGTIVLYHPNDVDIEITVQGIKPGRSRIRVASFDNQLPMKIILSEGVYELMKEKDTPASSDEIDEGGTFTLRKYEG